MRRRMRYRMTVKLTHDTYSYRTVLSGNIETIFSLMHALNVHCIPGQSGVWNWW